MSDLHGSEFVDQEPNSSINALLFQAYARASHTPRARIRVSSSEAACRMAEANLGIAFANERVATCLETALNIFPLCLDEP